MILVPFKVLATSFTIWVFLTTILPQTLTKYVNLQVRTSNFQDYYPYESITTNPIHNNTIYYIIAHPDDEVMFFAPSILELAKPCYGNDIKLICLSSGNAIETMASIRQRELMASARILGVKASNVVVMDTFKDGMDIYWDELEISTSLKSIINQHNATLITFDETGVSNHSNHISLYYGVLNFFQSNDNLHNLTMYKLKSLNFLEKYSFTILTNIELFVNHISTLVLGYLNININISFFNDSLKSIKFYSDLNMLSISYAAMAYGHFSQMVWFRYGWLIFGRYLTYNDLIQVER